MYSGIKEKMNNYKNLTDEEKAELKQMCKMQHTTIREYLEQEEVPMAVRFALEDRLIDLADVILK